MGSDNNNHFCILQMNTSKDTSNDRRLFNELHDILAMFRNIFSDDKYICNSIDDAYEYTLMNELKLVPLQFDDLILKYVNAMKAVVKNINFASLADNLDALNSDNSMPLIKINSLQLIREGIDNLNWSKADRARVKNILVKFEPLFACVNKVVEMPVKILRKIVSLNDTRYDDLL